MEIIQHVFPINFCHWKLQTKAAQSRVFWQNHTVEANAGMHLVNGTREKNQFSALKEAASLPNDTKSMVSCCAMWHGIV